MSGQEMADAYAALHTAATKARECEGLQNWWGTDEDAHPHMVALDAALAVRPDDLAAPAPAVPVEPAAWGSVADLRERMVRARRELDGLANEANDSSEIARLAGKSQGVGLALSYLDEMPALAAPSPATEDGPHVEIIGPVDRPGMRYMEFWIDGNFACTAWWDEEHGLWGDTDPTPPAAPSPAEPEGLVERVAKAIKAADDAWMTEGGTQPPALTEEGARELARAALAAIAAIAAGAPGSTGTGGAATGEHAHDFLPVRGHPDDDECTFRVDGTDDTYCGLTEAEHPAPTPPVVPTEDEQP